MSKKIMAILALVCVFVLCALTLSGCRGGTGDVQEPTATSAPDDDQRREGDAKKPAIPEKLSKENGVPQLMVYSVDDGNYQQMDIESYVQGVLAGEMRNDWPMEALKAQAILARTFVLKFVEEKESKYGGADISTDIKEAQAYDESKINDRIVKAVEETRGMVISADGKLPYSWFHAHAGGKTELATAALEYKEKEPSYTQVVDSPDSDKAPTAVKNWTVSYTAKEVGDAAAQAGVKTGEVTSIEIGEKGGSGRAITFMINGKSVSAPALRLALGGTEFKSTLLNEVKLENGKITFSGSGYGHGVGLSQWGAYGMAESGEDAEDIIEHYFKDVDIVELWD